MTPLVDLLPELRRRRVLRALAIYTAAAFALLQAADLILPRFALGRFVTPLIIGAIVAAPFVLILAWKYDVVPDAVDQRAIAGTARRSPQAFLVVGAVIIVAITSVALVNRPNTFVENRVFIIPFTDRTGDPALSQVGDMTVDWIARGLLQMSGVEVVDPVTTKAALRAIAADSTGTDEAVPIQAAGRETSASLVVSGSFYTVAGDVMFNGQIANARTGKVLRTIAGVRGTKADLIPALEEVRQRVMGALATIIDDAEVGKMTVGVKPPTYEAYVNYTAGVRKSAEGDLRGAREYFNRALAADTSFTAARLSIAQSFASNLFERDQADSVAKIVEKTRDQLSPLDRFALDFMRANIRGDRVAALYAAQQAALLAPGSKWHMSAANAALSLNRPRAGLKSLDALGGEQLRVRKNQTFWTTRARMLHFVGDHRAELKNAKQALVVNPDGAWATLVLLDAYAALGDIAKIDSILPEVEQWGGNKPIPGPAMHILANELDAHGHPAAAHKLRERAMAWLEAQPPTSRADPMARGMEIHMLWDLGRRDEAIRLTREPGAMEDLDLDHDVTYFAAVMGDVATAEAGLQRIESQSTRKTSAHDSYIQAVIATALGQQARAVQYLQRAFSAGFSYNINIHRDPRLTPLRNYPAYIQLMKPKG